MPELAQVLEEKAPHLCPPPPREETLLSVLGLGHYENPLSDVLAFFLKPLAEHGLGLLFLKSFLSCMNAGLEISEAEGISVIREAQTSDVKRPDFIIQGSNWLLMIEHKVWSGQNNPFASYEELAKTLSGGHKQVLYAVLSPHGQSVREHLVTHLLPPAHHLLPASRPKTTSAERAGHQMDPPRRVMRYIDTYITPTQTTMTFEEAQFVEEHQPAVAQVECMAQQYRQWLQDQLSGALTRAMPKQEFATKWIDWGIRCSSQARWGRSDVVLLKDNNVRIYLPTPLSLGIYPELEQVYMRSVWMYWHTTVKNFTLVVRESRPWSIRPALKRAFPSDRKPAGSASE